MFSPLNIFHVFLNTNGCFYLRFFDQKELIYPYQSVPPDGGTLEL